MSTPERKKFASVESSRRREKQTEEQFFPNLATVGAVLEAARIGIWCWDVANNKMTWSNNLEAIHQLPAGRFDGTYACFEKGIDPQDRPKVEAAFKEALRTGQAYRARYRLAGREDHDERWLESSGTIVVKDSVPERMLGLCYDITERVNLETELRNRVRQQETLARVSEHALAEPNLERLLNDAVSMIALTLSVDFVKILELLPGCAGHLLRAGFGWESELIGSVAAPTGPHSYAQYTMDSSLPVVTEDFAAEPRFAVDDYLHRHGCVSGVSVTIAGRDNRCYGILGVCTKAKRQFTAQDSAFLVAIANMLADVIARRQIEQRHELMIRELRHSSGNLFSQLLALFSQTARNSRSIAELANKYRARVLAVANAQRLIAEGGGRSTTIMELLYAQLGPYLERTTFTGPNVELEREPVFNLGAALQELTENAVMHGSLSRPEGYLELSWSVTRTERGVTLVLDWVEKNGPPARQPRRIGFGSRLIALVIERQLNGEVRRSFTRKGLSVHMIVPLTLERWPAAEAAASGGAASST